MKHRDFTCFIYSKDLQKPPDVRPHTRLRASGNWATYFTTQEGRFNVPLEFIFTARK
jgi:hypothetical protein